VQLSEDGGLPSSAAFSDTGAAERRLLAADWMEDKPSLGESSEQRDAREVLAVLAIDMPDDMRSSSEAA
jgi:hypothetical protein